jgi:hypothetical protein
MNGKGSAPRNCFSAKFKANYEGIDWGKSPVRGHYDFLPAINEAHIFGGNPEAHEILNGWKTYLHRKKKGTKCEAQTKRDSKR